jgi:hypothetical protein
MVESLGSVANTVTELQVLQDVSIFCVNMHHYQLIAPNGHNSNVQRHIVFPFRTERASRV